MDRKLMHPIPTGIAAAGKKFGRYTSEPERQARAPKIKGSSVEALCRVWKSGWGYNVGDFVDNYPRAVAAVKDLRYSKKDILHFSLALAGYQEDSCFHDKAGWLLSALINSGKSASYLLYTAHLNDPTPISHLCFRNTKNVLVKGGVGDEFAREMQSGRVVVEGNADELFGYGLYGGKLVLKGNAGERVGFELEGGEIHLKGDYKSIHPHVHVACGGKIFHKGVKIVDGLWWMEGINYG
jgi:hypothetical protein